MVSSYAKIWLAKIQIQIQRSMFFLEDNMLMVVNIDIGVCFSGLFQLSLIFTY